MAPASTGSRRARRDGRTPSLLVIPSIRGFALLGTLLPRPPAWPLPIASHSLSFDHRRFAPPPLTAIASALRCPTRTKRRLPRVTPACTVLPMSPQPAVPTFTPKQGQYLAFIYAYTRVLGRPPAEAELQRHFGVSPPSVHQMVLTLERAGLIRRQPGVARSIEILIAPELLPVLR